MPELVAQPYIIVRLVDSSDSRAEMRLHVRRSTSRTAGIAGARQLATLLDAASGCTAIEHILRYPITITQTGSPATGSDQHRRGVLVFATTDPAQLCILEIPGIKGELVDPTDGTRLLQTANPLSDLISALINGEYCNPFGYQLTECIAALYQVRQN